MTDRAPDGRKLRRHHNNRGHIQIKRGRLHERTEKMERELRNLKRYRVWRQIGKNNDGEAIYKNLDTGEIAVEKDHMYLVSLPQKEAKRFRERRRTRKVKEKGFLNLTNFGR